VSFEILNFFNNFHEILFTDTHSGPAGFHMFVLYDLTALGFVHETFYALVRGITQSIITAHNSMVDGRIFISQTEISDANINRSPLAYANNPAEERAQFKDNTDKTLVQLRFMDKNNKQVLGAFNWFAGELFEDFLLKF
jgi:neutral ceramidase